MRYWKKKPVPVGTHVGVVVATYGQNLLPTLGSLQVQTYPDFTCMVVHDGPAKEPFLTAERVFASDARFEFACTPEREKVHGHSCRRYGFRSLLSRRTAPDLLCTTNGDNYYMPVFLEAMAEAAMRAASGWSVCNMVHSHKLWSELTVQVRRGYIDAASWMARSGMVVELPPWGDEFAADWHFLDSLRNKFGQPVRVPHTLLVHN